MAHAHTYIQKKNHNFALLIRKKMETKVANLRNKNKYADEETKYIGRGSVWGNPFIIKSQESDCENDTCELKNQFVSFYSRLENGNRSTIPNIKIPKNVLLVNSRKDAIDNFKKWLLNEDTFEHLGLNKIYKPTLQEIKSELKGKILFCFCSPNPCHGDLLAKIANE